MSARVTFKCSTCEKIHQGLPAIAFDAPGLTIRYRQRSGPSGRCSRATPASLTRRSTSCARCWRCRS